MTDSTYYLNLVIVALMWTAASFSYYVVQYMTKYFEGNLFTNYYLDSAAGIVGTVIAQPLYRCLKIKYSFLLSLSLTIFFLIFLFLFQENHISPRWITAVGAPESSHPVDSKEDHDFHLMTVVPMFVFITKVFINVTFLNVY